MYVCTACIVIYFICTEISGVVIDYFKAPSDIHLYLSTLAFCGAALTF
jgi:phosphate starvation-inducible membrane PsiE